VPDARDDDVVDPRIGVAPGLPWQDPDRRPARILGAARRGCHDAAEAAADEHAAPLREKAPHLLGARILVAAAPDHADLRHPADDKTVLVAVHPARGGTLIVGGGFAGSYVARFLGSAGATIVSPENFMLYTPMLPEAASGTLEPRHVVVPLRMMCREAELLLGRVTRIDEAERRVHVETEGEPLEVSYERLVLALGAVPRTLPIPGLAEHGLGFKSLAEAIHLRNHVLRRLEAAVEWDDPERIRAELTFVFVGAGYAGVEALGELSDLVRDALRYYPELRSVPQRWVLVDAAPKILSDIPTRLGEYAARQLDDRGVEIRVSTELAAADGESATLSDGTRIPTRTLVWTAGVRAHPLLPAFGMPLDERGRVRVDSTLKVEERSNVWALGDCARVPNEATPDHPDPPTCQHALRQARRLAENLQGEPRPYRYRMLGQVATLGRYKGTADVLGVPLRGFPGWFVTRTYHLFQLPLPSRKLRVVTDWTTALFFRRDIAELSMLGHRRPLVDE
jgi:NADH:ubiquinone reductase (H+-translocating)